MKALTLHQPWASLIALGVKTIETRSWRAPQALIGQRIAIHAGKTAKSLLELSEDYEAGDAFGYLGDFQFGIGIVNSDESTKGAAWIHYLGVGLDGPDGWVNPVDLPFGAVVAIATLADCVPMVERDTGINIARYVYLLDDEVLHVNQTRSPRVTEMSDQLPYGDFRPGRWAWMLSDIDQLAEPIPATGKQGVWEWTP